ncbi:MAG: phenylalanine--tRNA ligase subunit beta [Holophagaceae bacterium]|nr:phenylalanine--tRNA ligase subunit beta [Holophagaceae bacterium]
MLLSVNALQKELPAVSKVPLKDLCDLIASLGFPIDDVAQSGTGPVLDVDITANRGDVMSHRGLARDLAAKLGQDLSPVDLDPLEEGEALVPIRLEADACPLYSTAVLTLGAMQTTPEDVRQFLASLGSNAKDMAAVDASNELLHRYGHPTHAFDADKLRGGIVIRHAAAGEKITTLDGVERTLTEKDLVIADDRGPIALAGLMGGESTKVDLDTRRVLLESAWFEPRVVRAMARRHGLHTDASHRFGRGADPSMARIARDLLAARLKQWAWASLDGAWTEGEEPGPAKPISLTKDLLHRIAGEPLSMEDAALKLQRLGCEVEANHVALRALPPSWRHDLALPEDLAEEVLRLRGYDLIPSTLPPVKSDPEPLAAEYQQRQGVARRLACLGFFQTVTLGFISPEADAEFAGTPAGGRTLGNPLGYEYSILRGSLLSSLKHAAEYNLRQGAREVRLFEIAPTFHSAPGGPEERSTLGIVWAGETGGLDPLTPKGPVQPAALQGILAALGVHGAPAQVRVLEGGLLAAEVALADLPAASGRVIPPFQGFSRFPSVERDLSLVVPFGLSFGRLAETIQGALMGTPLHTLTCVDIYRGKGLPDGHQAWLLRLIFQGDRTLTGDEVDVWVGSALEAARSLKAELRG